jgi:hypothetical protein
VLSKWLEMKRDYMDFEVQRRGGRVLVIDHTFKVNQSYYSLCVFSQVCFVKVTKAIAKVNGEKIYDGFFSHMNEYSEVTSFVRPPIVILFFIFHSN